MDVIEIITKIAEASIGVAALAVLAVYVVSSVKSRGADNDVITTMAALLTRSQDSLDELQKQTAANNAALERSNDIDERMIKALTANTEVIERGITEGTTSREAMKAAVGGLQAQMAADKGDLLDRLDALEASVLTGFTDLGEQVEHLTLTRVEEERANQTKMNKTLGEVLSVIHELRRMVQVTHDPAQQDAA